MNLQYCIITRMSFKWPSWQLLEYSRHRKPFHKCPQLQFFVHLLKRLQGKMQYTYTNETQLHALRLRRYLECFAAGSLYAPRSINPNSMYNGVERHDWSWCHWEANFLSDQRSGQVQLVMLFVNQGMERSSWHATKHLKIFIEMDSSQNMTMKQGNYCCPTFLRIVDILDVQNYYPLPMQPRSPSSFLLLFCFEWFM